MPSSIYPLPIGSDVTAHEADTTAVHGIADTSALSLTSHDHDADYEAAGGIATHSADSTSVHGIADTSALSLTSHDHDADYEAAGGIATHSADSTAVHGIADTSLLSLTSHDHDADYEATGAVATHAGLADPHTVYLKESDFDDVDFLVGTATGHTAAEIVVGTTPGGELGGTWASPTVDATHAGSTHTAAVTTHEAAGDPHTGYRLESADHDHTATGLQGGTVSHDVLTGVSADDHHAQLHTASHLPTGTDPVDKFTQSAIGTADLAIANTETVVVQDIFAANELTAGMTFMFRANATRAGTTSASEVIRVRIGTTALTGNIAATLTPPVSTLAVPVTIEGIVTIRTAGAGGTALGSLERRQHLAAVTITSAINPLTATVAVNTTTANLIIALTFISGNAANTYTFRNAVIYRVA